MDLEAGLEAELDDADMVTGAQGHSLFEFGEA